MKYLLDTNIVIYLQKGVLQESLPIAHYGISIITEIELRAYSALTVQQRHWLALFINDIQVFNLSPAIKEKTIELRLQYRLKLPDAIVCATALVEKAILLTNDKALHQIENLSCQFVSVNLEN
jgi:predicted nucleic acid-binding protein